jgi:hypothetical protein
MLTKRDRAQVLFAGGQTLEGILNLQIADPDASAQLDIELQRRIEYPDVIIEAKDPPYDHGRNAGRLYVFIRSASPLDVPRKIDLILERGGRVSLTDPHELPPPSPAPSA